MAATSAVRARRTITGRRLDGPAAPVEADRLRAGRGAERERAADPGVRLPEGREDLLGGLAAHTGHRPQVGQVRAAGVAGDADGALPHLQEGLGAVADVAGERGAVTELVGLHLDVLHPVRVEAV